MRHDVAEVGIRTGQPHCRAGFEFRALRRLHPLGSRACRSRTRPRSPSSSSSYATKPMSLNAGFGSS